MINVNNLSCSYLNILIGILYAIKLQKLDWHRGSISDEENLLIKVLNQFNKKNQQLKK